MFKVYVLSSVGGGPNFQRESIFCNKISSEGSLFIKKLVPGGNNFGGSIFTMTGIHFFENATLQPSKKTLVYLQPSTTGS